MWRDLENGQIVFTEEDMRKTAREYAEAYFHASGKKPLWPIVDKCTCGELPSVYEYEGVYRAICDKCHKRGDVCGSLVDALNSWNNMCEKEQMLDAKIKSTLAGFGRYENVHGTMLFNDEKNCPFDETEGE